METIKGKYTDAVVYSASEYGIEEYAKAQIKNLCDNPAFRGCKVRIMPDVHPGKVGTVGFTSTLGDAVLPNVVGADIGCGMILVRIRSGKTDFQKLDRIIREKIPSGFSIRDSIHHMADGFDLSKLNCFRHIQEEKALLSLGTLGGGNHFIEIDRDDEGNLYLVIHSGSRHLGAEANEFYLREGSRILKDKGEDVPYELTYLTGELMKQYLHDQETVMEFAALNREIMVYEILKGMKWKADEVISCVHNYVDMSEDMPVIRKGAISAKEGEKDIIPINMRDGIIIGTGLGNSEWNFSAPHGAGRILNRTDVKAKFTVSAYKNEMKGIYSTCIGSDTLDEAPFAYRNIDEIADAIKDTVKIEKIIRPVYSFKAGGR